MEMIRVLFFFWIFLFFFCFSSFLGNFKECIFLERGESRLVMYLKCMTNHQIFVHSCIGFRFYYTNNYLDNQ